MWKMQKTGEKTSCYNALVYKPVYFLPLLRWLFVTMCVSTVLQTRAAQNIATTEAKRTAKEMAYHHAGMVQGELSDALKAARTLADLVESAKVANSGLQVDRDLMNNLLKSTLEKGPQFFRDLDLLGTQCL